jgi:glycosyltransferase involved in cell wall biosynthesis
MPIPISAIVCTYNRADFIVRAIESLSNQTLNRDDYEILVVDNGSRDDTRRLVEDKFLTIPNLRYVYEPRLGLSVARNAGVASSRGRILAFLDDDAIACPGYLEEISRVFESTQPSPGLLCGPVEPIWGAPRPGWLKDDLLGPYSVLNWSETPRALEESEWIAGANFAVARDVISACGVFDERLGRKGASLLSGEDTALTDRIRLAGYVVYYAPAAMVQHYIHPERISKTWFYRRVFWGATSRGMRERHAISAPSESIRYVYRRAKHIGRRLFSIPRTVSDADRRLRWTRDMTRDLGRLYGFFFLGR